MKYYLDTEFDGFAGRLLSLALVREDDNALYLIYSGAEISDPWVKENVAPILKAVPNHVAAIECSHLGGALQIERFMRGDPNPVIITDWPDDVSYFCKAVITDPGEMVGLPRLAFEVHRVDAYPTTLPGAIQHNAWWDAAALKHLLTSVGRTEAPA